MLQSLQEPVGRREANKRATRAALLTAARTLFSEHGFEATTVRDIARAANVTERTFYRYFEGKEGLIGDETLVWIGLLQDRIRDRPAPEPPLRAVMLAMLEVAGQARDRFGPLDLWLFSTQPRPFAAIRRFTPRPLVRLERAIADAILARSSGGALGAEPGSPGPQAEFEAGVLARVAVAALRSAVIHRRDLGDSDIPVGEAFDATLCRAFALLGEHASRSLSTRERACGSRA